MRQRIPKLRERLAAAGGDAFFSLSPPANQYLSGFRGSTSAIAVTHTEAVFLCDFRYTEQAQIQVEGWAVEEVVHMIAFLPATFGKHHHRFPSGENPLTDHQ